MSNLEFLKKHNKHNYIIKKLSYNNYYINDIIIIISSKNEAEWIKHVYSFSEAKKKVMK